MLDAQTDSNITAGIYHQRKYSYLLLWQHCCMLASLLSKLGIVLDENVAMGRAKDGVISDGKNISSL